MTRQQSNNQPIIINEPEQSPTRNITFSYSENFNWIIELSSDNYSRWRTNNLYILMINNLENYVLKEKVK